MCDLVASIAVRIRERHLGWTVLDGSERRATATLNSEVDGMPPRPYPTPGRPCLWPAIPETVNMRRQCHSSGVTLRGLTRSLLPWAGLVGGGGAACHAIRRAM
jgi:hypothetical protein